MPATTAFCTSSKLARPLTSSTPSDSGVRPARNWAPISLSRALCRPTSSRRHSRLPSASNRAAACRPPVRSKTACAARSASGSRWMTAASTTGRPAGRRLRQQTRTASSDVLPHTPQLDEV